MRIIILSLLAISLFDVVAVSQNTQGQQDDAARIALTAYIPSQDEGLPASARGQLQEKLVQVATRNGMNGVAGSSRFIITANITVLTRDITPTAPPMHALTLEVNFHIGDGHEGLKFASASQTVKGVGTNETKAYMAALKLIRPESADLSTFVEQGKKEIMEYYNTHCDFIIKEAQTLEGQLQYEAAIAKLTSVPSVCKDCYMKCMDAAVPVFKKSIDRQCQIKLDAANMAWAQGQNAAGAQAASVHLSAIEPSAACYPKAVELRNAIAKRLKDLEQREWDFKLKEQQQKSDVIKAVRDIGVAFGNGQPKNVTYNVKGWW